MPVTVERAGNAEIVRIKDKNNNLEITINKNKNKNPNNPKTDAQVIMGTPDPKKKSDRIDGLELYDNDGNKHKIKNISDGTIIETETSPGCTWYFFGGVWYRICD